MQCCNQSWRSAELVRPIKGDLLQLHPRICMTSGSDLFPESVLHYDRDINSDTQCRHSNLHCIGTPYNISSKMSRRALYRCRPLLQPSLRSSFCLTPSSFASKPRDFSISKSCRIMEMSGFSETQLDVREAISKICSNFTDVTASSCALAD